MRSLLALLPLISLALGAHDLTVTEELLDQHVPIYLGHVFWLPIMTFIARLPSQNNYLTEWCYKLPTPRITGRSD
jgi:hypothetical protein